VIRGALEREIASPMHAKSPWFDKELLEITVTVLGSGLKFSKKKSELLDLACNVFQEKKHWVTK